MIRPCRRTTFKWGFCLGCVLFIVLKVFIAARMQADLSWDQPVVGRHVQLLVQGNLDNNVTAVPTNMTLWKHVAKEMEKKYAAMEAEHNKLQKLKKHVAEVRQAGGIKKWNKQHQKPPPTPRADVPKVVRNISMFQPPWLRDKNRQHRFKWGKRH